ncbi:hypothetical protein BV011_01717 [Haemophilus influenzae]|nr:hypothetical protein BV011_01717 [Haemophilus influenzae]
MKKLENYRDFSQHAAEMERVGAWEQAATVARCQENQEWAENRRLFCAHYVRYPARRLEVNHG